MVIVDDRAKAFLEEVQRALAASRAEAGLPPVNAAPDLGNIAAAVREAGLRAFLNNITAATISSSVSCLKFLNSTSPVSICHGCFGSCHGCSVNVLDSTCPVLFCHGCFLLMSWLFPR